MKNFVCFYNIFLFSSLLSACWLLVGIRLCVCVRFPPPLLSYFLPFLSFFYFIWFFFSFLFSLCFFFPFYPSCYYSPSAVLFFFSISSFIRSGFGSRCSSPQCCSMQQCMMQMQCLPHLSLHRRIHLHCLPHLPLARRMLLECLPQLPLPRPAVHFSSMRSVSPTAHIYLHRHLQAKSSAWNTRPESGHIATPTGVLDVAGGMFGIRMAKHATSVDTKLYWSSTQNPSFASWTSTMSPWMEKLHGSMLHVGKNTNGKSELSEGD